MENAFTSPVERRWAIDRHGNGSVSGKNRSGTLEFNFRRSLDNQVHGKFRPFLNRCREHSDGHHTARSLGCLKAGRIFVFLLSRLFCLAAMFGKVRIIAGRRSRHRDLGTVRQAKYTADI